MLKRRWSATILRYLDAGMNKPAQITAREPLLSPKVVSERLRTMLRYKLVWRYPQRGSADIIEYRLSPLGKRILGMLDTIDQIDLEQRNNLLSLEQEMKQFPEHSGKLVEPSPTSPSNAESLHSTSSLKTKHS